MSDVFSDGSDAMSDVFSDGSSSDEEEHIVHGSDGPPIGRNLKKFTQVITGLGLASMREDEEVVRPAPLTGPGVINTGVLGQEAGRFYLNRTAFDPIMVTQEYFRKSLEACCLVCGKGHECLRRLCPCRRPKVLVKQHMAVFRCSSRDAALIGLFDSWVRKDLAFRADENKTEWFFLPEDLKKVLKEKNCWNGVARCFRGSVGLLPKKYRDKIKDPTAHSIYGKLLDLTNQTGWTRKGNWKERANLSRDLGRLLFRLVIGHLRCEDFAADDEWKPDDHDLKEVPNTILKLIKKLQKLSHPRLNAGRAVATSSVGHCIEDYAGVSGTIGIANAMKVVQEDELDLETHLSCISNGALEYPGAAWVCVGGKRIHLTDTAAASVERPWKPGRSIEDTRSWLSDICGDLPCSVGRHTVTGDEVNIWRPPANTPGSKIRLRCRVTEGPPLVGLAEIALTLQDADYDGDAVFFGEDLDKVAKRGSAANRPANLYAYESGVRALKTMLDGALGCKLLPPSVPWGRACQLLEALPAFAHELLGHVGITVDEETGEVTTASVTSEQLFSLCLLCTTENCSLCKAGEDPRLYTVKGACVLGRVLCCEDHVSFIDRLLDGMSAANAIEVLQNLQSLGDAYLMYEPLFVKLADVLPLPRIAALRDALCDALNTQTFVTNVGTLAEQRRLFSNLVKSFVNEVVYKAVYCDGYDMTAAEISGWTQRRISDELEAGRDTSLARDVKVNVAIYAGTEVGRILRNLQEHLRVPFHLRDGSEAQRLLSVLTALASAGADAPRRLIRGLRAYVQECFEGEARVLRSSLAAEAAAVRQLCDAMPGETHKVLWLMERLIDDIKLKSAASIERVRAATTIISSLPTRERHRGEKSYFLQDIRHSIKLDKECVGLMLIGTPVHCGDAPRNIAFMRHAKDSRYILKSTMACDMPSAAWQMQILTSNSCQATSSKAYISKAGEMRHKIQSVGRLLQRIRGRGWCGDQSNRGFRCVRCDAPQPGDRCQACGAEKEDAFYDLLSFSLMGSAFVTHPYWTARRTVDPEGELPRRVGPVTGDALPCIPLETDGGDSDWQSRLSRRSRLSGCLAARPSAPQTRFSSRQAGVVCLPAFGFVASYLQSHHSLRWTSKTLNLVMTRTLEEADVKRRLTTVPWTSIGGRVPQSCWSCGSYTPWCDCGQRRNFVALRPLRPRVLRRTEMCAQGECACGSLRLLVQKEWSHGNCTVDAECRECSRDISQPQPQAKANEVVLSYECAVLLGYPKRRCRDFIRLIGGLLLEYGPRGVVLRCDGPLPKPSPPALDVKVAGQQLRVKMQTSSVQLPGAWEVLKDPRANMRYFGASRAMERLWAESCAGELTAGAELLARHRCCQAEDFLNLKRPEYSRPEFLRMLAERHPSAMKVLGRNALEGVTDYATYNQTRFWGVKHHADSKNRTKRPSQKWLCF